MLTCPYDTQLGSITDVLEEISTFAAGKNPSVKVSTLQFVSRSLGTTTVPPSKTDIAALTPVLLKALEDSQEPVRVAGIEALGILVKCVGERALGGAVDVLDDGRKAKVREQAETAVVKVRPGMPSGGGAAKPPAPAAGKPKPVSSLRSYGHSSRRELISCRTRRNRPRRTRRTPPSLWPHRQRHHHLRHELQQLLRRDSWSVSPCSVFPIRPPETNSPLPV